MMNGMQGQEPEAAPPQEGGGEQAGGAKQLVSGIHTQLMALMDLLEKSGQVGPEDKEALGQIIAMYQGFVKNNLGSAPGQKPEGPPQPGSLSPEAGANPNARPM